MVVSVLVVLLVVVVVLVVLLVVAVLPVDSRCCCLAHLLVPDYRLVPAGYCHCRYHYYSVLHCQISALPLPLPFLWVSPLI